MTDTQAQRNSMQWLNELRSEGDHATRLVSDLEYFAKHLKIRPKVGPLTPLVRGRLLA